MDMQQQTKIILAHELLTQGVPKTHIATQLGINRDTVRLWQKGIDEYGLGSFLDRYQVAKKGKRKKRKVYNSPTFRNLVINELDW